MYHFTTPKSSLLYTILLHIKCTKIVYTMCSNLIHLCVSNHYTQDYHFHHDYIMLKMIRQVWDLLHKSLLARVSPCPLGLRPKPLTLGRTCALPCPLKGGIPIPFYRSPLGRRKKPCFSLRGVSVLGVSRVKVKPLRGRPDGANLDTSSCPMSSIAQQPRRHAAEMKRKGVRAVPQGEARG